MAKKTPKTARKKSSGPKGARKTTPRRKAASKRKPAARGRKRPAAKAKARPTARRKSAAARRSTTRKKAAPKRKAASSRKAGGRRTAKAGSKIARRGAGRARGGSGRERTLAQTPTTGRSVKGPTNPMPTRRSTGTPSGAGSTRHAPGLDRERRRLRDLEEELETTPPSSLDMDRMASAARTGRAEMRQDRREHTESSPALTGGDVDANWQNAYATGDEAPGGDNPTPDQDRVDDIGKALGVTYEDNEELKASDKIAERDRHRWELDPASSEDYRSRDKDVDEE